MLGEGGFDGKFFDVLLCFAVGLNCVESGFDDSIEKGT